MPLKLPNFSPIDISVWPIVRFLVSRTQKTVIVIPPSAPPQAMKVNTMPKLTDYAQIAGTIFSAGASLYGLYQQLEPTAKTAVDAELTKVKSVAGEIISDVATFRSASWAGKIAAGIAVFGALDDAIDVAKAVYADGATMFASDWPLVKAQIDAITGAVTGKAVVVTPVAAPVLAAPASA